MTPTTCSATGCLARPRRLPAGLGLLGLIAVLFLLPRIFAATYYISNAGSDSADGETEDTPWVSIGRIADAGLEPGDVVLFRRGDTWTGVSLMVPASGTAQAPIRFGAYGEGAKPVLTNAAGPGIGIFNRSHVVVEDLNVKSPTGQGVSIEGSEYITVRRVDVSNNGGGPGINAQRGGWVHIDGCVVTNAKSNGIQFRGSVPPEIHDSIIENCTVTGTQANDGIVLHADGSLQVGSHFIIRNNVSNGNAEQGYDVTTGQHVLLEGNRSTGNLRGGFDINHFSRYVTVLYHHSENEPTLDTAQTMKIGVSDVTVAYSRFLGPVGVNKPIIKIQAAEYQPENVVLHNNLFVWQHSSSGPMVQLFAGTTMQDFSLRNNILTSNTAARGTVSFAEPSRPPSHPGYLIDHNLYHSPGGAQWLVNNQPHDFASYRDTFGRDANGLEADPLFVDAAGGDFRLQVGSPAIDAGAELGLTRDLVSTSVPQGGAPDIGAYEFSVGPAAPTGLTATAVSAHRIDLVWTDNATDETAFRIQRKDGAGGVYAATVPATVGANTVNFSDTTGVAGSTTYHYQVRAENASGYSAWSAEAAATTPEAPLNVAITAPAHGAVLSGQGITISASTSGIAAVAGVTFKLDGVALTIEDKTAPYGFRWTSLRTTDGSHQLTAVARGTEGNTATSAPVTIIVDNLPPSVALTAPAAGAVVGGVNIQLTASASDLVGVAGVQFKVNGQNLGIEDTTAPYAATWDATGVGEGSHTVTVVARDLMGRTTVSAPVSVTVDHTPPTVAITAPASGSTVEGTVAVSAEASDGSAIAGVQFKLNGANLGAEDMIAPFSVNWSTAAAGSGSHTLTAVARDAAGNTATSAPVTVTVANAAPLLFEAELLAIAESTDTIAPTDDAGASNGRYVLVNTNVVGDYIVYTINVPADGTYLITTGLATQGNRGIFQLSIDGVNQGSPQDYYTPGTVAQFTERNLGTKILTAGAHSFRFLCTGRHASSGNRKHALDYIKLAPQ